MGNIGRCRVCGNCIKYKENYHKTDLFNELQHYDCDNPTLSLEVQNKTKGDDNEN